MDLRQNHLIVRHEDTAAVTNADLAVYDSSDDTDLPFAVSGGALTVPPGAGLLVWTNKIFRSGRERNACRRRHTIV
jgi:hypothetical protein